MPPELVQLIKEKMKYGKGRIEEKLLLGMNKYIKILKTDEIIEGTVQCIGEEGYDKKRWKQIKGNIKFGGFTKNIVRNPLMLKPYRGDKYVIKAIIIAAFEKKWKEVYDEFYDSEGNLKKNEALGIEVKNTDFKKLLKTIALNNWSASANFSTPQWANFVKFPINEGLIKSIRCQIITTSEYYRFGFKLFRKNGKLFGDGSIQSMDNNFVIHYGKNFLSNELFITTYRNGILQRPDKYIDVKPSNNRVISELFIDNENILYLILNGSEVFKFFINKEIREQVYMLAWADGNEFEMSVENIEIEFET